VISSISLRESREILLWLLSAKAGMPLCTDVKSQYSSHTAIVFQIAKVIAEALTDTKLMMKPLITGARSLQVKSIRLIIELILVRTPGGWPSDITTTLHFENNYHHIRKCKTTAPLEIILLSSKYKRDPLITILFLLRWCRQEWKAPQQLQRGWLISQVR